MKSVLAAAAAILSLAAAEPALAALAVGDSAPLFTAQGAQGDKLVTVELAALLKQGPVVIYFFPSSFTESEGAKEFAANAEAFRAAGATVVGMSRDTVEALASFSAKVCGGKFPVASAEVALVDAFDVNDGAQFNTRTTYVIAPSGKIAFVNNKPEFNGHVKSALAFVQGMKN